MSDPMVVAGLLGQINYAFGNGDLTMVRELAEAISKAIIVGETRNGVTLVEEEVYLIEKDKKVISAIKHVKERLGVDLREAKRLVDKFRGHTPKRY